MNLAMNRKAEEWYAGHHLPKKGLNKETIKETLILANLDADAVASRTELVYNAAELVENGSVWEKKLYSSKAGSSVVFYNSEAYIDCYGNCFSNEDEFLKILSFFDKQLIFTSQDGTSHNLDKFPTNTEVIQIVLNALSRNEKDTAFSAFYDDCNRFQVIKVLQKIKSYFLFFYTLDEKTTKSDEHATFVVTSEELHILFSNLRFHIIDFKNYKLDDYKKLMAINLDDKMIDIPYEEIMIHLCFKNYNGSPNFEIIQSQTYGRLRFNNCIYRNYCHFAAIKIFKYMSVQPEQLIKCREITEFKSMIFWVDARFRRYTKARKEFQENERNIKEEYCELLNLINDPNNRSRNHGFSQPFSAAYHFQEHYAAIADILRNDFHKPSSAYPKPTSTNKKECVKAYLKTLPDDMFDTGEFEYRKDKNPSIFKTELRQSFYFLKYEGMIKAVKYKFVDPRMIKTGTGSLPRDQADLEGTWISTISQNV